MRCEVCGGEFGHGDIRVGVVVPVWLDRNGWGQRTEPYAVGVSMDVCNGCYEGAAVLHGSGDGTVTFELFEAGEGVARAHMLDRALAKWNARAVAVPSLARIVRMLKEHTVE